MSAGEELFVAPAASSVLPWPEAPRHRKPAFEGIVESRSAGFSTLVPTGFAPSRRATNALEEMACCCPMYVNAADYGAVGDWTGGHSGTDNTTALQAAINAACASGANPSGIFLPPGAYRITGGLVVPGVRGFRLQGSGRWTNDAGVNLGSQIVADGPSVVLSLEGTNGFVLRDFSIRGSYDTTIRAKYGLRLRPVAGYGTGSGLVENMTVFYCTDAINCGSGGPNANAADVSFVRCEMGWCENGFHAEQSQQVNYDFYGCSFGFLTTCINLTSGGNIFGSMFATYDVQRVVYVQESGDNIGSTTMSNLRLDGIAYRTVLYEMGATAIGAQATFIDVRQTTGTPAGGARIKLGPYSTFHLIGGRNLCYHNQGGGPLFNLTSAGAGHCSILVEDTGLPTDTSLIVGTLTGTNNHYRIRNCVNEDTAAFITDFSGP